MCEIFEWRRWLHNPSGTTRIIKPVLLSMSRVTCYFQANIHMTTDSRGHVYRDWYKLNNKIRTFLGSIQKGESLHARLSGSEASDFGSRVGFFGSTMERWRGKHFRHAQWDEVLLHPMR